MSYNFTQVITKLSNGKNMARPGWSAEKSIMSPLNVDGVLLMYPENYNNPATLWYPKLSDLNATDWIEAT